MKEVLYIIPRVSYELLAYFVPGAFTLFGIQMALLIEWRIDGFSAVKAVLVQNEVYLLTIIFVLASYIAGRALYILADLTVKPLIKKFCGDPDKYLPLRNKAVLKEQVKDYKPYFKKKLQSRLSNVFGIAPENLVDVPYFKLCTEWIELHSSQQAVLLKQKHTIEIFARNMAAASLALVFLFGYAGDILATIVYLISGSAFVYYYYVRQVMRARSVYETFFVLTSSSRPTIDERGKNLQTEIEQVKS